MLLNTPSGAKVATRLFSRGESLHAPHLIDLEVAQVLRRWERVGDISPARAIAVFKDLANLTLTRYSHHLLLPRVWALRRNATAYDAAYLALAEALDATLLTRDMALSSIPGHSARVEVVT